MMESRRGMRIAFLLLLAAAGAGSVQAEINAEEVKAAILSAMDKQLGSVITHYDATRARLMVIDTERRHLAVYDTESRIELITSRALDADLKPSVEEQPPAVPLPAADLPGQDPPHGFRLEDSVRYASRYAAWPPGSQTWGAKYYAPGSFDDAVEAIRQRLEPWNAERTDIEGPSPSRPHPFASFSAGQDRDTIKVELRESQAHPGWVWLEVVQTRKD